MRERERKEAPVEVNIMHNFASLPRSIFTSRALSRGSKYSSMLHRNRRFVARLKTEPCIVMKLSNIHSDTTEVSLTKTTYYQAVQS